MTLSVFAVSVPRSNQRRKYTGDLNCYAALEQPECMIARPDPCHVRANARDLRKISAFGRKDKPRFFTFLASCRDKLFLSRSGEHLKGENLS